MHRGTTEQKDITTTFISWKHHTDANEENGYGPQQRAHGITILVADLTNNFSTSRMIGKEGLFQKRIECLAPWITAANAPNCARIDVLVANNSARIRYSTAGSALSCDKRYFPNLDNGRSQYLHQASLNQCFWVKASHSQRRFLSGQGPAPISIALQLGSMTWISPTSIQPPSL